jgi:hypothetical protein
MVDKQMVKAAYKAFKKRLSITQLVQDSKWKHQQLTGGSTCKIVAINTPLDLDFPPTVWDELVKRGRLNRTRDGLLAIPEKTTTKGGL